jgi:ADP-heptose:LPS heptosyltransferase
MKKLEIILKNFFLRILLMFSFTTKGRNVELNENSKVLFIRLNRIGDALITTPLIHFIKEKINPKIFVVADRKNYFVYYNNPYIDEVIVFNKGLKGIKEILKFIKDKEIDAVVDLHYDVSTTVSFIIALCKAPVKIGLEKDNKSIYTHLVKRLDPGKYHIIDRVLELAKLMVKGFEKEITNFDRNIEIFPSKESFSLADDFISNNYRNKKKIVGINISAGSAARFWGVEKYKKLIDFISSYDLNILILSSITENNYAEEISNGKLKVFSSLIFEEFAAIISKLSLLITPDTAAVHLSSAFEVPVFGLYVKYKTKDLIWSPYKSKFDCVITEDATLDNVTVEEVMPKLKKFVEVIFHPEISNG